MIHPNPDIQQNQRSFFSFLLISAQKKILSRLPLKKHRLLAWKLSFIHNFSPQRAFLGNNSDITQTNLWFLQNSFKRNRNVPIFCESGNILSYKGFMAVQDLFHTKHLILYVAPSRVAWFHLWEVVKLMKEYASHVYRKKNVMFTVLWIDGQIVNPLQKENSSLVLYECCL